MNINGIKERILRNTAFTIVAKIVSILVSLIIIPFLVGNLGPERYGIWITLFAFVDYFNLLDFGFGAATVKFTADIHARNELSRLGQIIIVVFLFNACLLPIIVTPIFFADSIIAFFQIGEENLKEATFVLRATILIFAFTQLSSVFQNILVGLQLIDIKNSCEIFNRLLFALGAVLVVNSGLGLKGLIILAGVLRIVLVFTFVIYVIKKVPNAITGIRCFDKVLFKEFFKYGTKVQITTISGLFNFQLDKLLIAHFLRIELVTFYDIGAKIASFIRQIPSVMFAALIPASAELDAMQDRNKLKELHVRGTKYVILAAAPIACFLSAMAPTVILVWMGTQDFPLAILALRLLAMGYFFNIITGVVTSIVRGIGVLKYEMQTSLFIALANLSLSLFLVIKIGFLGALIGTAGSMILGNSIYLFRFGRFLNTSFTDFLNFSFIKPTLMAVSSALIIWSIQFLTFNEIVSVSTNRLNSGLYLTATGIVYCVLYIGGLVLTGFVGKSDLVVMGQMIGSLRRK